MVSPLVVSYMIPPLSQESLQKVQAVFNHLLAFCYILAISSGEVIANSRVRSNWQASNGMPISFALAPSQVSGSRWFIDSEWTIRSKRDLVLVLLYLHIHVFLTNHHMNVL